MSLSLVPVVTCGSDIMDGTLYCTPSLQQVALRNSSFYQVGIASDKNKKAGTLKQPNFHINSVSNAPVQEMSLLIEQNAVYCNTNVS